MRSLIRHWGIHFIMILALVSAGTSPACAFVSGKTTLIEICGVDGLMTVSVPSDEAPASNDQADHKAFADCGFCLMHASGKALTTPDQAIIDFSYVYAEASLILADQPQFLLLDGRLPVRGPPAFL